MVVFELCCWLIVAYFLVVGAWRSADARRFVLRFVTLSAAAWIGEQSCIELYRFYQYSPRWSVFIGHVPLLVVVIWPAVILSAFAIAERLAPARKLAFAGICAGLILADASLIEPVSVRAGLWSWNEPGLFAVPPIGVLGWVFFSAAAAYWFRLRDDADRVRQAAGGNVDAATVAAGSVDRGTVVAGSVDRGTVVTGSVERGTVVTGSVDARAVAGELAVLVVAPLFTHAALLATWWGALRWVNVSLPPWPAIACAGVLLLAFVGVSLKQRLRERIELGTMLMRIPPALLFLYLLLAHGRDDAALLSWFALFVPPYLSLTAFRSRSQRQPAEDCQPLPR